jgi:kumamolisin
MSVLLSDSVSSLPDNIISKINAPLDQVLNVIVILKRKSAEMTIDEHAAAILNGSNQNILTHQEFIDTYGSDQEHMDAVTNWANLFNIETISHDSTGASVTLTGTVENFNRLFNIELLNIDTGEGNYITYEGQLYIDDSLNEIIITVLGLHEPPILIKPNLTTYEAEENIDFEPASGTSAGVHSLTPIQVASAYSFPSGDGSGACIGLIEYDGGYTTQNLTSTFSRLGLSNPTIVDVLVDGKTNNPSNPESAEVMLDIYVAAAAAPKAKIAVYFGNGTTYSGLFNIYNKVINDTVNNPTILSISWTSPEYSYNNAYGQQVDNLLAIAVIKGITIFAATGDTGSWYPIGTRTNSQLGWPAANPNVIACGGTRLILNTDNTINSEVVWNGRIFGTSTGGSTGGVSAVYPVPSWQTGLTVTQYPTNNVSALTGRSVPDIAGNGDPQTGYQYYFGTSNQLTQAGGTSAVCPLYAGLYALINSNTGKGQGFITDKLYARRVQIFRDITTGNGDYKNTGGWSATNGWDACTGLGVASGSELLALARTTTLRNGLTFPNIAGKSIIRIGQTYPPF